MSKLSVVLAVYNEEANLGECLSSVKSIADEMVIVDGGSTDASIEIAKSFGAKIIQTTNPPIFHINKQKAIDAAKYDWILLLDADERVSSKLASEISNLCNMSEAEMVQYEDRLSKRKMFVRHQALLEKRDGSIGTKDGEYAAFFLPRVNYFLGGYLRYGGVYPDGVIRLFKKGEAWLPCKDVHEQMHVEGRVGWLENDLYHVDSPTFSRYLSRNSRYINLLRDELKTKRVNKGLFEFVKYMIFKPIFWFGLTFVRHKGFLDGFRGFVFCFFSALRFPRAYWRYITNG